MSKTMADHARAYRKRRADKMARYEAALREICDPIFARDWQMAYLTNPPKGMAVEKMQNLARAALGDAE